MEIASSPQAKAYDGVLYSVSQKGTEQQGEALRRSKTTHRSMADRSSSKRNVVGSNPTVNTLKAKDFSRLEPKVP